VSVSGTEQMDSERLWLLSSLMDSEASKILLFTLTRVCSCSVDSYVLSLSLFWSELTVAIEQLTVCTAPFIYWRLDNNAADARFLSVEDKKKAVERLRANNTGTSATESFKWGHVWEAFLEIKTYLYVAMALLLK